MARYIAMFVPTLALLAEGVTPLSWTVLVDDDKAMDQLIQRTTVTAADHIGLENPVWEIIGRDGPTVGAEMFRDIMDETSIGTVTWVESPIVVPVVNAEHPVLKLIADMDAIDLYQHGDEKIATLIPFWSMAIGGSIVPDPKTMMTQKNGNISIEADASIDIEGGRSVATRVVIVTWVIDGRAFLGSIETAPRPQQD